MGNPVLRGQALVHCERRLKIHPSFKRWTPLEQAQLAMQREHILSYIMVVLINLYLRKKNLYLLNSKL